MPQYWKRVAERSANRAFSSEEISNALIPALEHDCRAEICPELIHGVRGVFDEQEASLFKEDVRAQLEALRGIAGCGVGRTLLDNVVQISPNGVAELDDLARAMTAALQDHAARRARQIEEHYCRKSTSPRAENTRTRIEQSIAGSPLEKLARQLLKLEARSPARTTIRQQGLDDGVRI